MGATSATSPLALTGAVDAVAGVVPIAASTTAATPSAVAASIAEKAATAADAIPAIGCCGSVRPAVATDGGAVNLLDRSGFAGFAWPMLLQTSDCFEALDPPSLRDGTFGLFFSMLPFSAVAASGACWVAAAACAAASLLAVVSPVEVLRLARCFGSTP